MSGLLSVVGNPRRRRRKKATSSRRRKTSRRRRSHVARVANPRRRRRVHAARRHSNPRRRRHHNPLGGGLGVNTFVKGVTGAGVGAIGARIVSNFVKNQFLPAASPVVKLGITAGVGILGGWIVSKFLKQRALGAGLTAGAAIVVALDAYEMFLAPMLPANFKDYQYGGLNDYQQGALNGFAPLSDWAPQSGMSGSVYEGGVYE
jgi:hypothetical protein